MKTRGRVSGVSLPVVLAPVAIFAACLPLIAQQPRLQNAKLETRSAAAGLEQTFRSIVSSQSDPAWIGYAVPIVPGERQMCCFNGSECCSGCRLETASGESNTVQMTGAGTVQLEGPAHMFVLYRVEQKQVGKLRTFTPDCAIDGGGLPFFWLTDVKPAESITLLETMIKMDIGGRPRLANTAVSAIAMHRDAAADAALDRCVAPTQTEEVRRQAAFWLGNARGRHGFEVLNRLVREDPSDRVREHAIFALTQSKEPEAMNAIVRAAHDDANARVRGQALFWLAQRASAQISTAAIQQAIANDPETEVKKRAVFALTQIPHGDGVPMLIEVARTNKNAVVRKQAMFWLGQSKDPRALKFFEDVLAAR